MVVAFIVIKQNCMPALLFYYYSSGYCAQSSLFVIFLPSIASTTYPILQGNVPESQY